SPLVVAVVLVRRKCVVEVAEEVVHVEVLEVRALASGPLREGLVPVGVVLLAFLFVAQHFTRPLPPPRRTLGDLLELLLGTLLLVLVWVVLHGQLAEGFLDLSVRGRPVHPEQLVVVLSRSGLRQVGEKRRAECCSQKCHAAPVHLGLQRGNEEAMSVKRCTICDPGPESLSRQNKTGRQDSRHDDGKLAWNVSSARCSAAVAAAFCRADNSADCLTGTGGTRSLFSLARRPRVRQ
ncbi:unnamed protein product, partial [Ixodes pacificus]